MCFCQTNILTPACTRFFSYYTYDMLSYNIIFKIEETENKQRLIFRRALFIIHHKKNKSYNVVIVNWSHG